MLQKDHRKSSSRTVLTYVAILIALHILGIVAGCHQPSQGMSIPADWPIRKDVLPPDAKIDMAFSSQEYEAEYGSLTSSSQSKTSGQAVQNQPNEWSINFETKLSHHACRDHLEQVLKEEDYRYLDDKQPFMAELEPRDIRWYYSPDGKYKVTLNQVKYLGQNMLILLVIESIQPNSKNYEDATPIK